MTEKSQGSVRQTVPDWTRVRIQIFHFFSTPLMVTATRAIGTLDVPFYFRLPLGESPQLIFNEMRSTEDPHCRRPGNTWVLVKTKSPKASEGEPQRVRSWNSLRQ